MDALMLDAKNTQKSATKQFNPSLYDYKTGGYHNKSGSFLTLAEANASKWIYVRNAKRAFHPC
jgi:hypothetical protein